MEENIKNMRYNGVTIPQNHEFRKILGSRGSGGKHAKKCLFLESNILFLCNCSYRAQCLFALFCVFLCLRTGIFNTTQKGTFWSKKLDLDLVYNVEIQMLKSLCLNEFDSKYAVKLTFLPPFRLGLLGFKKKSTPSFLLLPISMSINMSVTLSAKMLMNKCQWKRQWKCQ